MVSSDSQDTGVGRKDRAQVHAFDAHWNSATSVTYSQDGKRLISAGAENSQAELPEDITIHVFDAVSGKKLKTMRGHTGSVHVLIPVADERLLSASEDGTIRLWDLKSGKELKMLNLGKAWPVQSLAVSNNGEFIAGALGERGHAGEYRVWKTSSIFPGIDLGGTEPNQPSESISSKDPSLIIKDKIKESEITYLKADEINPDQAMAIAEVKKLNGEVEFDRQVPVRVVNGAIIKVVSGIAIKEEPATDATLKSIIKGCPHLQSLVLWRSPKITDAGLTDIRTLIELDTLVFYSDDGISDIGLKYISELPNLKNLSLSAYKVTDVGMKHLAQKIKLERLELWSPLINDDGLSNLRGLVNLKELNIGGTRVTDSGLKNIENLHKLEILGLNRATTDAGLEHIQGLSNLKELTLETTKITDDGLKYIGGLTALENLYIGDTGVTDAGLEHLKKLHLLKNLNLAHTKISDAGLRHVGKLTNLEELCLNGTAVTDKGLGYLIGLKRLRKLELIGTKTTEDGLEKLERVLPHCYMPWTWSR